MRSTAERPQLDPGLLLARESGGPPGTHSALGVSGRWVPRLALLGEVVGSQAPWGGSQSAPGETQHSALWVKILTP